MFTIERKVSTPSFSNNELFQLANKSVDDLFLRLELKNPKMETAKEGLSLKLKSDNFFGEIRISDKTMTFTGEFNSIFSFGKSDVEKQLDIWFQEIFQTPYDM